ncbi:MAG: helix-turn-helix domain-containing protein [Rhodospirillaceae bacterium]|nr:helix-turn-helix domain-containing protein [Rhodospirillaceae bacterium]
MTTSSGPQLSSPKIVLDLFAEGRKVAFAAGATLFREGDPITDVYCMDAGRVVVTRYTDNRERQILAFLFPGDFLGMSFGPVFSTAAEALTAVTVWALPQSRLTAELATRPELGLAFAEMSARILNNVLDLVFTLGRKNSHARVASFLLHLRDRQALLGLDTVRINVPMTRQDIADFLGLTMETVSRAFTHLKTAGAIRIEGPADVSVVDLHKLNTEAGALS